MDEINLITHLLYNPKKLNIYKEYSKFQINDCSENFTHEPIVFVYYFEKST